MKKSTPFDVGPKTGHFGMPRKGIANDWIEWWKTENVVSAATWFNNMEIFVTASDPLLHYSSEDTILDIGCGPGYLAAFLKDTVKEVHCLDISQRYLDICKQRFAGSSNIFCHKLSNDNYTDLSFLQGKQFSIIVCQSVIQYYKEIREVENLIKEVQRIALPGARFLISDIPTSSSIATHVYNLFKGAFRKKRLFEISKMLFHAVATAKHRRAYLSSGLLTFSDERLMRLIGKLNLDAEVLRSRLTVNENRRHLLIKF